MGEGERPVVRLTGGSAPLPTEVLEPEPPRQSRPRRRWPAAVLVGGAGVVAAVLAHGFGPGAPVPEPSAAQTPVPAPSAAPAPSLPVPDPVLTPRPVSTDLRTTVSVGHVRVPGETGGRQIELVSQALASTDLGASFVYSVERTADGPGVEVDFDRRLPAGRSAAFATAVSALHGAAFRVTSRPGSVVDVSVPLGAGAACAPGADHGDAGLVLPRRDMAAIGRRLRFFGLVTSSSRATISYQGPARTPAQLRAVGAVLARACGAPAGSVTYTRGAGL